jgi:hypothetical protein
MNIKNYTSTVPVHLSLGRIENNLVQAGASDISKKYSQAKECEAITFRMEVSGHPLFFRIEAKVEECFKALSKDITRPRMDTMKKIREQAERTAWKIWNDWVEIQLSLILLDQADAIEIFLPFVYDMKTETTLYKQMKNSGFKLLPGIK